MAVSPPDHLYYLKNFERALEWTSVRYDDLLSEEELSFLSAFQELTQAPRALLVRLLMRVGSLFRRSTIQYREISDLDAALRSLIHIGWINPDPTVRFEQISAILPKSCLVSSSAQRRASKAELCEQLAARHGDIGRPASQWEYLAGDALIDVQVKPLAERFRLLFFGNFHQEWKEFVLADLGIFRYEPVELDREARAFHARRDIEDFYALAKARDALYEDLPVEQVLALVPAHPSAHRWLERKRTKLLFGIAREQERAGNLERALDLYRTLDHVGARFRYVRTLERLELSEQAYAAASAEVASAGEVLMLERARSRIGRKLGFEAQRKTCATIPMQDVELDDWECVERCVADALSRPSAPAYYVENGLFNALFGLLYWDAIYAPVPGAFFHPFQRGPADLWSDGFMAPRSELIARANALLDQGSYREVVLARYEAKQGIMNPFVSWHVSSELLSVAMQCIPSAHLRAIFDRMWLDVAANTTGFPDLVKFDLEQQSYQLMEIKAPGDRLQDHQRSWLQYFAENGIPASVCRVRRRVHA